MGKGSQEDLLDGVRKSPLQTRLGNAGTEKGVGETGRVSLFLRIYASLITSGLPHTADHECGRTLRNREA